METVNVKAINNQTARKVIINQSMDAKKIVFTWNLKRKKKVWSRLIKKDIKILIIKYYLRPLH